jgi:glycosyltransferase involved in cell wall biosynthesis
MPSVFFISLMSAAPWGGSEELWYRTAIKAAEKGWKVGCAVYHWQEKEKKMQVLKDVGGSVFYLPNKGRSKRNLIERIQNKISKKRTGKYIYSLPVSEYDVVVVNLGAFEITTSVWKDFYKVLSTYVLLYHNYQERETFGKAKATIIQNWAAGASLNLFASGRIRKVLEENGISISQSDILINPISIPVLSKPLDYPREKENYRFVVLAALEVDRKAQDVLINALAQPKWKERNWSLHLYGKGKDNQMLARLIVKNNLQDKVFLEGQAEHVEVVLRDAHLLLQLTRMDAMPLSVVEAMAAGRPVAASSIGDMPEWIVDGRNGWLSRNASIEEIDRTMERAWEHRLEWEEMGKRAFELFNSRFVFSPEEKLLNEIEGSLKINFN